ncbi:hypothetical protein V2J09_012924 [Rumex salicifolius]
MPSMPTASTAEVCRHVAVCPFPFSSHPATLLLLSRTIAASAPGVHVTFFTTEASAAALSACEDTGVWIRRIDDGLKGESAVATHPLEGIRRFMEAAGESLRRSMAAAEEEVGVKISCVVADAFLSCVCQDIAEEKAVKWVALWTSASAALTAHMYTDELRSRIQAQDESLDIYISGLPPVPVRSLAREVVMDDISSSPIAQMLHQMSHIIPKASAVAINSFDTLEPATTDTLNSAFGDIFLTVGPYSLTLSPPSTTAPKDPEGCLQWLDTHAPTSVVYISFGTAHTPPQEEFGNLAEALEEAGVPFLWSLPERLRNWVPEGFVERTRRSGKGKVVAWAPQTSVLGHVAVGAQLTHCGWNSVVESIVSGVPLICRALPMAEQRFNERLVVDVWGIGVEVDGGKLTRTTVVRAVERVLVGEEGATIRQRICEMKRLVEQVVVEPHGSSIRNLNKFINIIISD